MNAAFTNPNRSTQVNAWLVCKARVLASAEVATTSRERRTGLIGRRDFDGALVIPNCRWIHTVGVKFPIDVAYLDDEGAVIKTVTIGRFRVGSPVSRAHTVIEARHGAFDRWGLQVGEIVEIRPIDPHGS